MRTKTILALLVGIIAIVGVEAGKKPRDPFKRALHEQFPAPPASLDSLPGPTGLLLLHAQGTRSFKVRGAILQRAADGELIRISCFEKGLLVFPDLTPGRYWLRLLKFKSFMGQPLTMTLAPGPSFAVDVEAGTIHYLGLVRARIKTVFNSRAELEYELAAELEAWGRFKTAYAESPWIQLVDRHVDAIESGASGGSQEAAL